MPTLNLTDASCRSLAAVANQPRSDFFDGKVKGLALRVTAPSAKARQGYKTFTLTYRFAGVQKRLTMEPRYPELGLAEARTRARSMLAELHAGVDPAVPREAAKRDTFGAVYDKFYAKLERNGASVSYLRSVRTGLGKYVLPKWCERPIISITKREGAEIVEAIADGGRPSQANHVRAVIARVFDFAVDVGIDGMEASVMARLKNPAKEKRRKRVLNEAELAAVWRVAGAMAYPWGPYLRMLMLTLQRRTEVGALPWGELDADRATWTLPPERHKTEAGNVVPVAPAVRAELARCPHLGLYVFTTSWGHGQPIRGFGKFKKIFDRELAAAGTPITGWTLHDLRRTGATRLGEHLGVEERVVEEILGHVVPGIRGTYQVGKYLAQKREALDRWAAYLTSLPA
jgi:integrase